MAGMKDVAKEVGLNPLKVDGGSNINTLPIVEEFFKAIVEKCAGGERVKIKDFGTFKVVMMKGRKLKTPLMEGETRSSDMLILKFRQANSSKKALNADKRVEQWGGTYIEKPLRPSDIKKAELAAAKKAKKEEKVKKEKVNKNLAKEPSVKESSVKESSVKESSVKELVKNSKSIAKKSTKKSLSKGTSKKEVVKKKAKKSIPPKSEE